MWAGCGQDLGRTWAGCGQDVRRCGGGQRHPRPSGQQAQDAGLKKNSEREGWSEVSRVQVWGRGAGELRPET